jgi:HD superfamily phosphohydrolase
MMRTKPGKGGLESKLIAMPHAKVLQVLESIDELDQYILHRLRSESPTRAVEWESTYRERKSKRTFFEELHRALSSEGGGSHATRAP